MRSSRHPPHATIAAILAGGLLLALSGPAASAADAGTFLKGIEGSWHGQGTARIPGRDTEERINCRVENNYDKADSALIVNGACATTQSKSTVKGRIDHSGDNVSGALIGSVDGATITKSTGSVQGDRLVVSTNFVDNATGTLTRTQQVIHRTGSGFDAEFYLYDNKAGKFMKAGAISFKGS